MNKKSYTNEFVNECKEEFDSALNNDFNIPVALTAFYKLIREINSLAADEKITCDVSSIILPELERMMDILGINIVKISDDEKDEINHLIEKRNVYRNEKNQPYDPIVSTIQFTIIIIQGPFCIRSTKRICKISKKNSRYNSTINRKAL